MYILAKGRCQIEFADPNTGNVKIVGEIGDGSCFGELGEWCFLERILLLLLFCVQKEKLLFLH